MELSSIVFTQVLIIFVLLILGVVLTKIGMIKDSGLKQITDILLYAVTPCLVVNAYQKDFSKELASGLLASVAFSVLFHIISILICTVCFKREETKRYRVSIFSSVYSNCGYMAIPLLTAALGSDGVFYGSAYLAVFTVFYWTHGICVYKGDMSELSFKKLLKNPGLIGTFIALLLFLLGIKLPYVIGESVKHMANLNTPLAMIVMGAYLAKTDFKKALTNISVYIVSILRLIVLPIVAVLMIKVMGLSDIVAKSVLITAACPTAAVTTLLAAKYNLDASYSAEVVAVSTVFSIITIPLVLMLI